MATNRPDILSDEEAQALILNLAETRGDAGFTDLDAQAVISWAEDARIGTSLLNLALNRSVSVNVKADGTVGFSAAPTR